jgi:hypothetical protein
VRFSFRNCFILLLKKVARFTGCKKKRDFLGLDCRIAVFALPVELSMGNFGEKMLFLRRYFVFLLRLK